MIFLIVLAKALEDADMRIYREIPTYEVKVYSYVDDFNCTAREKATRLKGRRPDAITAASKARTIVSEDLGNHSWIRVTEKDEEIKFRTQGEAMWVGIIFTYDLS